MECSLYIDLLTFYDRNQSTVGNNNYRISINESPLILSLLGNKYFYTIDEYNNNIYKELLSQATRPLHFST